jgi:hypothetical protein
MAVPPTALADVKITSPSAESAVVGSAGLPQAVLRY